MIMMEVSVTSVLKGGAFPNWGAERDSTGFKKVKKDTGFFSLLWYISCLL